MEKNPEERQFSPPPVAFRSHAVWRTLLERKVTVLGVTGLFAAVTGLYVVQATPQYQSVAVLQLESPGHLPGQQEAVRPATPTNTAAKRHRDAQLTLLKSRHLAELVVDELGLERSPLAHTAEATTETPPVALAPQASDPDDPPLRLQLTREWPQQAAQRGHSSDGVLHLPDDDVLIARETAIRSLRTALSIVPAPESRLVEVRVLNPDPAQAARIANAIAKNFIKVKRMQEDRAKRRLPPEVHPVRPPGEPSREDSLNTDVPDRSVENRSDFPQDWVHSRLEAEMQALVAESLQWYSPELQDAAQAADSHPHEAIEPEEALNGEHHKELLRAFASAQTENAQAPDTRASHATIVVDATPARTPDTPRPLTLLGLALVLGLITGALTALRQTTNAGSAQCGDGSQVTQDFTMLGSIPATPMPAWASGMAVGQLAHTEPHGALAEAYRRIALALQSRQPADSPHPWLVTSQGNGEGKTTTAVALAITWAQLGQKVLLIDADLRHPGVHQALRLPNAEGLSLQLTNPVNAPLPLQATDVENLSVLTAGPLPSNPLSLLTGTGLSSLLDTARRLGFEQVVIDGPSLQGLADALVMANLVQQVVLVVKETADQRALLQAPVEHLRHAGATLVQVVQTQVRQA